MLFAAPHEELLYQIDRTTKISCSNWGVLDALRLGLTITEDHGEEVAVLAETPLTTSLARFLAGSTYECRLAAARSWDYAWKPLVVNKYKQAVAMVLSPSSDRKGWVIVLPRMRDRADLSLFLLDDVFPNLSPSLFPSLANASWLTSPPYEDPDVLRMREEIQIVERDARQKQEAIEAGIAKQREHRGFLHTLLTGTGNELVVAVHRTLELLGFSRVVDVDAASDADLREDLQVEGLAGLLLIEVKGVNGTGSDDDALAVLKYVAPRMRELKRTDVHALTILNHQRAQPALERMPNPFRDVVVQTAQQNHCGLMTTWTLFRLARNFERLGWQHGHVAPLFTTEGVISPIPAHYRPIGKVEMRWRNALGVRLIERLERGERIATESGIDFFEQSADSLQLEGEPVEGGAVGELVGVATKWTPKMCSDGATIFKVTTLA